jgi:hypothetical protein
LILCSKPERSSGKGHFVNILFKKKTLKKICFF